MDNKSLSSSHLTDEEFPANSKTPQKFSENEKNNSFNFSSQTIFFSEIEDTTLCYDHVSSILEGIGYIINDLQEVRPEYLKKKEIFLDDTNVTKEKTLFLDLDETLIHTCDNGKHSLDIEDYSIKFNIRPNCLEFLQEMSKIYEIYIFTASILSYAEAIVNFIDPKANLIDGIVFRNQCLKTGNGQYIKDLRIIANREIKNMLLVDNITCNFGKTYENGIPICNFTDDENDIQLLYLRDYLIELSKWDDVREVNKKNFNSKKLCQQLKQISLQN